ncbi:MAG: PEP-CTERM sorting domain-containing protein [Candidatus Acidiferrales bacterium]
MRARIAGVAAGLLLFGASSAFAGRVNFSFGFVGPDKALGKSAGYASNGATITAYGYKCWAKTPSSTDTLSHCVASDLYEKDDSSFELGLGLAGEDDHEIGWDGPHQDYVMGLNVSDLFDLGATSMTLTFGSVEPGEAFAVLGYGSDPFTAGTPFALTNTKAWFGNDGSYPDVDSATFDLNAQDEYLVLISPCGASPGVPLPCGSNVTLVGAAATNTPEPGTVLLFATGLLALALISRRRWAARLAAVRN